MTRRRDTHGKSRSESLSGEGGWRGPAVLAMLVDAVGVLPIFLTGVLAIQLHREIDLGVSSLGVVYASYFIAAAIFSAPMGSWAERRGPERSLRLGLLVYVAAFIGIAVSARSTTLLVGYIALSGLGTALTRNASSVYISRRVRPGRQGLAFGVKHCSIPVASLLAGLAVPTIALTVGWEWAYVAAAVLALLVLAAIPSTTVSAKQQTGPARPDLSRRTLILAAVAFALGSAAGASLGTFTVTSAVSTGMAESTAGLLVAVGSVIGLISRVAVGYWTDHRVGNQLDVVTWMLVTGGLGFVLLSWSGSTLLWLSVPLTFATGWAWLGSYNLAMVRLNPIAPGSAVGITQTGAFVGGVLGPLTLGFVADHTSFTVAWWVAAGLSFVAAGMIGVLQRVLSRRPVPVGAEAFTEEGGLAT